MTEEQMTLIKTLIKKHGISATDGEWTLVFLGASYGLTEKQIASYLIADTSDLLAKHEKMLCILFGIEPESNGEIQRMENPAERLQMLLAEYLAHNQSKQGYEEVMEIRRCIEFYEMMEKEQEPHEKAKKNRRERR